MRKNSFFVFFPLYCMTACEVAEIRAAGAKPPTAPAPRPTPQPTPTPPAVDPSANFVNQVKKIVADSSCKNYEWKDRGRAPQGYVEGMALSFARSLCRENLQENAGIIMASKLGSDSSRDALKWFEAELDAKKLEIDRSGPDTLRTLYTLGIGLGMRESSGKHCEGYDVTAENQAANTAESGMFQFSYDSINSSPELKNLYAEYRAKPSKCYLGEFSKNVSCKKQSIVGSGAGADFQTFVKSCPAFAAEYAMITLRVLRRHYGPINRKEAEIQTSCNVMLDQVQNIFESRRNEMCAELR